MGAGIGENGPRYHADLRSRRPKSMTTMQPSQKGESNREIFVRTRDGHALKRVVSEERDR